MDILGYLRQPSSLIAAAIVIGTGIADWFGVLPEGASIALFGAAIPLLAISEAFWPKSRMIGTVWPPLSMH